MKQKNSRISLEFIYHLSYCSFVCTGGLFLIIIRQAKRIGVYLTLQTPLPCVWRSLFEIWLSNGVYLNIAKEFLFINSASDLEFFHNCSLKGGNRIILESINNLVFA